MKNPNGYGSVSKLNGNRRKPWCVRITTDWSAGEDDVVRQKQTVIGCYATREEAMLALAEYHKNPYKVEASITFAEVYSRWSEGKFPTISDSNIKAYKASYKACAELYSMQFAQIRLDDLQHCIDTCGKNYPTLRKIKILLNQLYDYAIQHDVCNKDYSDYINIAKHKGEVDEDLHKPFTASEREAIWNSAERSEWIQVILMLIYSGVRIGELLDLKKADVHLDERYFDVRKSKTRAGVRKVPIAAKVLPYWEHWMCKDSDYVVPNPVGKHFEYSAYKDTYFVKPLEQIGIIDHLPHDTRHTCISMLAAADVQKPLIKRIVGHQGDDVTDNVYTHYEITQLIDAIDRI